MNSQYAGGCYNVEFHGANVNIATINCNSDYDCYSADFYLNSVSVKSTLNGNGQNSLRSTSVYGANSNQLEINCNALGSCKNMDIFPPYHSVYMFSLLCMPVTGACNTVQVTITSSNNFINNYMELICLDF